MLGDNKTVVDSVMTPHGKMCKIHVTISFHRARESIAAKIVKYFFIDRNKNPSDVLTKNWAHHDMLPTLKPILIWKGDTMDYLNNNSLSFEDREQSR